MVGDYLMFFFFLHKGGNYSMRVGKKRDRKIILINIAT